MTSLSDPCRNCGKSDRYKNGKCRHCVRAARLQWQHRVFTEQPECKRCGAKDRGRDGKCRPCVRESARLRAEKRVPCGVCGSRDRYPTGNCKVCAPERNKQYLAANAHRPCTRCGTLNKSESGYCRTCGNRSYRKGPPTGPCAVCGENDRRPSGACRRCIAPREREYFRANPELVAAVNARRRKRARASKSHFTAQDVRQRLRSQNGKCWWCGVKVKGEYHVDHIIPLAREGSNGPENICISCPSCNLSKSAKMPWEFQDGRLF